MRLVAKANNMAPASTIISEAHISAATIVIHITNSSLKSIWCDCTMLIAELNDNFKHCKLLTNPVN